MTERVGERERERERERKREAVDCIVEHQEEDEDMRKITKRTDVWTHKNSTRSQDSTA